MNSVNVIVVLICASLFVIGVVIGAKFLKDKGYNGKDFNPAVYVLGIVKCVTAEIKDSPKYKKELEFANKASNIAESAIIKLIDLIDKNTTIEEAKTIALNLAVDICVESGIELNETREEMIKNIINLAIELLPQFK